MRPRSSSRLLLVLTAALAPACGDDPQASAGETATTTGDPSTSTAVVTTTLTSGASMSGSQGTGTDTDTGATTTASTTTTGATTAGETTAGETDTEGETTGGVLDDEAILRMAIAGALDPGEAIQTVTGSKGLPVATAGGTYLFACLCGPGQWRLAGDHNGWSPAAMTLGPAGLWWAEETIADADGALYKFVDEADTYVADPRGRRYGYDDFGQYSLVRASAPHLERWYGVDGYGLQPRDLQVYVPQGGAFTHAVFAHDGQNLFDPEGIWGGWHLAEATPPGMLVVGVDNTPARFDEYTHVQDKIGGSLTGGKADDYAKLVQEVIRPRMEAAYGAADRVAVMGSSLGGLVSFVIADRYPDAYDMVISLSATAGWGSIDPAIHNETILEVYEAAGKRPFAIYLDTGGDDGGLACVDSDKDGVEDDDDGSSDNYCENLQLRDILTGDGYSEGVDLWYTWDPGALHNEAAWASRVGVPLEIFAGL